MIALLPMKAHSERVPGKNFKDFQGKPLFQWVLESLLQVKLIEKVIINTDAVDSFQKFDICSHEKVILKSRPSELRGDFVSMNRIIENDISTTKGRNFIMTHSTNPLISSQTIERSISTFNEALSENFDSVFSVNRFQSRFYTSTLEAVNHDPNNLIRTQDLDPLYEENSCLYLFSKSSFERTKARIGEKPAFFETPPEESVDIDDHTTWRKAELYYDLINKKSNEL